MTYQKKLYLQHDPDKPKLTPINFKTQGKQNDYSMSVKEGIKKFRYRGNDAILKELNQLHNNQRYCPVKKKTCCTKKGNPSDT